MGELIHFPKRPTEPLLTKRQFARAKSRSVRWVEMRVSEGMPSEMRGSMRYFRMSETDPWLEARRSQSA